MSRADATGAPEYARIMERATAFGPEIVRFLRELIAIPSPSAGEERVASKVHEQMLRLGFDGVQVDGMGNVLGYLEPALSRRAARELPLVAFDAHMDTVGTGDPSGWSVDPYAGAEDGQVVWGRGASDQKGGLASMVYAGALIKQLGLLRDRRVLMVGSVQEEDCEGLCWKYIVRECGVRPLAVICTEPTSLTVCRGQRGRMEIRVQTRGLSCHGSAPERGENAIFKMAPILSELQGLGARLAVHPVLGKGSLTVSEIFFTSPSRCAVADSCSISVDRRLTLGETAGGALEQIRALPSVRAAGAEVNVYAYEQPSYTALRYPAEAFFPPWLLPEEHPAVRMLAQAYRGVFGSEPRIGTWTFSTNGVSIAGEMGIPCVGFGPGHEEQAHAPDERTWKSELVSSCALYAAAAMGDLDPFGQGAPS